MQKLSLNELFYNGYLIELNTRIYVFGETGQIFADAFNECPEWICESDIVGFNSYEHGIEFIVKSLERRKPKCH